VSPTGMRVLVGLLGILGHFEGLVIKRVRGIPSDKRLYRFME
jgi:hypothetical protein